MLTPAGVRAAEAIFAERSPGLRPGVSLFRGGFLLDARINRLARQNTPGAVRTAAPILLLVGTADRQVPPASNLELAVNLRRAGDRIRLRLLRGADHDHTFLDGRPQMLAFLRRTLLR